MKEHGLLLFIPLNTFIYKRNPFGNIWLEEKSKSRKLCFNSISSSISRKELHKTVKLRINLEFMVYMPLLLSFHYYYTFSFHAHYILLLLLATNTILV